MSRLLLFYRLIVRPLFREPVRTLLTLLAIALGIGVVLAIDLAGSAAAGSFQSSMETLTGANDLEIVTPGGVPENLLGKLEALPYSLRITPRMEDYAEVVETKQTLPLLGLDFVAESRRTDEPINLGESADTWKYLTAKDAVWVGNSLGWRNGDIITLLINDRVGKYTVRGVFPDSHGNAAAIVMDIAAAQYALRRFGRVDRILIQTPQSHHIEQWQQKIRSSLPDGILVRAAGAGTTENRRMLAAFRWNLQLLSYIALIVGAFLIYNTISVSVVRRRAEIGIARALGASRPLVLGAFVGEAACLGLLGASIGLPFGRLLAGGAVQLIGATVQALYVSSRPGAISLTLTSGLLALLTGVGVALASAYSPAREASLVPPIEAMALGRREHATRVKKTRNFWIALALGLTAALVSRVPAIGGKPLFGYLAALLLTCASAFATPMLVDLITRTASRLLKQVFAAEGVLASRSLSSSLRRTSVLIGALSTAIAMMTAVGIMVGSFRETVLTWMGDQLPADLYLRPAGSPAADRHPTIAIDLTEKIARLPGVAAIDLLREYEISYEGMPAGLGSIDLNILRSYHSGDFLSGRNNRDVLGELRDSNTVLVSEPFANKHHVRAGDFLTLSLGETRTAFRIADVYYDYSSERGSILMDRNVLLRYLPDPAASNLAIYVAPDANIKTVRAEIEAESAGHHVLMFTNRDLRGEALRIFDRTFAITYALEAIAVLVAVMGVAGALLALVIDRRRELGLLRFLGAASGQIRKLILIEAGLIGVLANITGIALGFALSLILIYVINKQSFGWTIRFHWPVAVLLGALSTVYTATLLSALYPARVAVRMNPVEVVHEE
jgi:putative ABC transport system permease protein